MSEEGLQDSREKGKKQHNFYLDDKLCKLFTETAKRANKQSASQALQEAMIEWIIKHQDEANMKITRPIAEPKAVDVDLGTRVQVAMIKEKLEAAIIRLERVAAGEKCGDRKFSKESVQKILEKAIPLQRRTQDLELEQLFSRVEKVLFRKREVT